MNRHRPVDCLPALVLLLAALACIGCGSPARPPLGEVSGTVTLDGQPLQRALVTFVPIAGPGRTSHAYTDSDGRYSLAYLRNIPGADVGQHVVRITTVSEEFRGRERLPARYHAQSTLIATVESGTNTHDFSLTSK
ncbi:MAG: carboxypeptidase-like regulatory domain-containing protein [Actinomycetota bacterium]